MNAVRALARLEALGVPLVTPADAAAVLGQSAFAASKMLSRLAAEGHLTKVTRGRFWMGSDVDPYRLAEMLTAPMPSYVSMQTALHLHGVIEQIPDVVYVATLGRSHDVETSAGSFSMHHLAPEVFGGFEERSGAKVASVEKALFDLAYLSVGDRRFSTLPELELPRRFEPRELRRWIERMRSARRKTFVLRRLRQLIPKGYA